ncbi:AmmeMemoRadiSam system protein B [archaeon]|nr:AmmeMemoRadiSam system protein B [archaeon]
MRKPYVAGQFYPDSVEELTSMLTSFFKQTKTNLKSIAGIAPHAGYVYSGQTAAHTHAALDKADTYVIIEPDHTGAAMGGNIAYPKGKWETPLGTVKINETALETLQNVVSINEKAHAFEHSIEVHLPFLQFQNDDFEIVPIIMGDQSLESARQLGNALASLNCAVIASTDFSHYVPQALAQENDNYAIQSVLDLDEADFYRRIRERNVSTCGRGPIAAAITFAKHKTCIEGRLLDYSTSGDITGDPSVVGYASIAFI